LPERVPIRKPVRRSALILKKKGREIPELLERALIYRFALPDDQGQQDRGFRWCRLREDRRHSRNLSIYRQGPWRCLRVLPVSVSASARAMNCTMSWKKPFAPQVMLAFGQMDQPPPGAPCRSCQRGSLPWPNTWWPRTRTYFLFMDNLYRFIQAGQEVSTLLGRVPAETGYQPTLASEVIRSRSVYVPLKGEGPSPPCSCCLRAADDMTDRVRFHFRHTRRCSWCFRVILSSAVCTGHRPFANSCTNLDTNVVGRRHYEVSSRSSSILTSTIPSSALWRSLVLKS